MPDRDPVDDVLRRSIEVEIPADVEARMRRQFTEFRARLDGRRRPVRELAASLLGQRPVRWAAATAVFATVLAMVFFWGGTDGGRVYAAAVSRLATARSVRYTMEIAPFVSVEFSHLVPAHERVKTSWGIEIRADGSGTQLILLHATRQYVREQKGPGSLARTADLVEQLTSLPRTADSMLGERTVSGRRFVGFRVMGTRVPGQHGLESLDLWLDAGSGTLDHVDLTPEDAGASGYQMHIRDIRVDADVDPALFEMTPPAGYSDARSAGATGQSGVGLSTDLPSSQPLVTQANRLSAIVIPMSGPYLQAGAAVANVAQHLAQYGIVPAGPAFGRFESESHWEVGYPVPAGTTAGAPFEVITVPAGPVASIVVKGPWGQNSSARWSRLLAWLGENGYVAVGPPTEVWSGDETNPNAQITELRIAVAPAGR
jgi:effector-binding domain-containing protein/outer membrane lipoprotein-sorting protein